MRLVLGTNNSKKRRELALLLEPLGFELLTLADFPQALAVTEDGNSFAENAALKATRQALNLQEWVVGEDSGLLVDALGGRPGIYSARYAGEDASDDANNRKLLDELKDVPTEARTAHYVCHITVADPEGNIRADSEARCSGRIGWQRVGDAGFGYDPLFIIPEYRQTFAQLGDAVKSILSHRARASRRLIPQLKQLAHAQALSHESE